MILLLTHYQRFSIIVPFPPWNAGSNVISNVISSSGLKFYCEHCQLVFAGSSFLARHKKHRCKEISNLSETGHVGEEGRFPHQNPENVPLPMPLTKKAEVNISGEDEGKIFKNKDSNAGKKKGKKMLHKNKSHNCQECGKIFKQGGHLRRHERTHTDNKPFKCQECGKSFTRKYTFNRHKSVHVASEGHMMGGSQAPIISQERFKCSKCEVTFGRECDKKRHEQRVHSGIKPHKCLECGRSFAWKVCLTKHQQSHTGEKPFECWLCEKKFVSLYVLRRHTMIHTQEKPYRCLTCNEGFIRSEQLKVHEKTHLLK